MGEYKRMISYIYSYRNGVKEENCGFARVEERNGFCKINIVLRIQDELDKGVFNKYKVFFYMRDKGYVRKIYLDDIIMAEGGGELKQRVTMDKLFEKVGKSQEFRGKKLGVENMSGIFICSESYEISQENEVVFASAWDDEPVDINDFRKNDDKNDNMLQNDEGIGYNNGNDLQKKAEAEVKISEIKQPGIPGEQTRDKQPEIIKEQKGFEKKQEEQLIQRQTELFSQEPAEMLKEELNGIYGERKGPQAGDYFKMLCGCYPKVKVDEIDGECIRITPHDISYLPKKYWHLCNNSFLLHGYYNYKYLLLCEKEINNEKKYLIGVPGMYHHKEQKIARMFGFTEFEGDKEPGVMKFGYWCMYL